MRMPVLLLLLAATPGPWAGAQELRGLPLFATATSRFGGWRLVVEQALYSRTLQGNPEPRWVRLGVAGVRTEPMGSASLAVLVQASELNPNRTRWMLLDPGRKAQASGEGAPDLALIEEALRKGAGALPWDTLEDLLRVQPDHGEARLAMAELALAVSAPWRFREPRPLGRYETPLPEARAALDKFLGVPEWPWQIDLVEGPDPERLGPRLRQQAGQLQDTLRRMAEAVLTALASDPENPRLQGNLVFLLRLLDDGRAGKLMDGIAGVEPMPGQEWPPLPLIHAQADVLRRQLRWAELLDQAQGWFRKADPLFLTEERWGQHRLRAGTLKTYLAMARSWREGWDILPGALLELRERAGGAYPELARLLLKGANLPEPMSPERFELFRLAGLPALPAPAMPAPLPPWRILVRDVKALPSLQAAFETDPGLVQWLRSERILGPQPSLSSAWTLALGSEGKEAGDAALLPATLAERMRAGRAGRLWTASERVAQQPEAIGPRKFRMVHLLQRMPCRDLESLLALDLTRARLGADLPVEDLDANLWFAEARHAIPRLEEHLRRWPLDGERWGALAFWTAFLPAHRGPVALAEAMPSFRPGLPFRLCLPVHIHSQVGSCLARQKAWPALRAWFEPAWEELQGLGASAMEGRDRVRELAPTFRSFLDSAYAELGLTGQRRQLQETGRTLEERYSRGRH